MVRFFYLTIGQCYLLVFGLVLSLILDIEDFYILLIAAPILFLFRQRSLHKQQQMDQAHTLYSPVCGTCISIKEDEADYMIKIKTSWWNDFGVRFPMDGKIVKNDNSGNLEVEVKGDKVISFTFNPFSTKSKLWAREGDRGQITSLLGYSILGGETEIRLEIEDTKLLIREGDKVFFTRTPLAILGE